MQDAIHRRPRGRMNPAGARVTGSPAFQASGEWAVKQLQEWGLQNVKLEKWGPFGKSWSLVRYSGNMIE
ncbi:MAG: hypothetical protein NTV51_27725, partial [Verrucomicrobia bacterium]|nr:hypothetical protein [Verrucomicrobiota bacterium]